MGLRAHLPQLELLRRSQAADASVRSSRAAIRRHLGDAALAMWRARRAS